MLFRERERPENTRREGCEGLGFGMESTRLEWASMDMDIIEAHLRLEVERGREWE